MIDCQLIPCDARSYPIILSQVRLVASEIGAIISLRDEGSYSQPPDILFLVNGTPESHLTREQVTHFSKFTAVIMLSHEPLSIPQRRKFTFPIHSVLTAGCPQEIFARALIRAMNRKNQEFSTDNRAAHRSLNDSLQAIENLQRSCDISN